MRIPTGTRRSLPVRELRNSPPVGPGEVVCLVRHISLDAEQSFWTLDRDPHNPIANETRWDGWLGCSDDGLNLLAEGAYQVLAAQPRDSARYPNTDTFTWSVVLLAKADNPTC